MRRTSDSDDDDNPLPKGKGGQKGTMQQASRGMSPGGASDPSSFLYSAEDPLPPSEVKVKEKRRKKKRRAATDAEDGVDKGQSFDTSQSFERSFESGVSAGRPDGGASRTSGSTSRLSYRDSFKRVEESRAAAEVHGQEPEAEERAENDAKKGEAKETKKIKFPGKLGKIFRKNRKPETKEVSVVETEMSAIPATLPSSGYLEPLSDQSSSHAATTTSYGWNVPPMMQRPTMLQGQRQTTEAAMVRAEEEEGMCEVERYMREKQRKIGKKKICESVFLSIVLVAGFVLGIILTAMSPLGLAFQIVGPTILGLSAFAIIGKIFVTVFWEEDPFAWTKGHLRKVTTRLRTGKPNKQTRAPAPSAAQTHTSLLPNPSYGGNENAPSPPPEPEMTSLFSGTGATNQYGGQRLPSISFDSTFSQDA